MFLLKQNKKFNFVTLFFVHLQEISITLAFSLAAALLLKADSFLFISDKWASRSISAETESTCESAIALTLFETNRAIVLCLFHLWTV